jgi:hypothetical protein
VHGGGTAGRDTARRLWDQLSTWEAAAWCVPQVRWRDYKSVVLRVSEAKDVGEFDRFKFYARTKSTSRAAGRAQTLATARISAL